MVCEKCKHPGATCTCQPFKIIGASTSSTEKKKALTVSEHIGTMVSFIESVSSGEVASESEKKIRAHLIEQGAKLAKQEHVLHEYTERGVVTDELRKQHSDAVQEWLAACHSFISVILRHPHFTEALAKFKETL